VATATRQHPSNRKKQSAARGSKAGWRRYLGALGPGLVTGASDDDPSGIATYAQGGAMFGLGLVWASLLTLPLMAAVQETCDRTALATGKGLGELIGERFDKRGKHLIGALIFALMAANALNVAADLVAVGSGMNLLHLGPTALWAPIAGIATTVLLITGSFHRIAAVFKLLCCSLLAYVIVMFLAHPRWGDVLTHVAVPHIQLNREYLSLLVAFLGTTISPYLFFWQSAHRVEEMREEPAGGAEPEPLSDRSTAAANVKQRESRLDVFSGMTLSNVVMFAIIVTTASTLGRSGQLSIDSAAEAATSLEPLAGRFASVIFAIGFIGSGALAIPVLAGSSAVGMAGLLGRSWGFSRSVRKAPVFYGLVLVGTVGGTVLSLVPINPIRLLVISAMVNGVVSAPFLLVVMLLANDRRIMGEERNHWLANLLGWLTVAMMTAAAFGLVFTGGGA
jgi:NRAMP (natural resistance-associated macrophage protein)-like metal ion transporter